MLSSGMSQSGDLFLNPALTQWEKRWHLFASTSRAAKIAVLNLIPKGTVVKLKSVLGEHQWRILWAMLHLQDFQRTLVNCWFHWYQNVQSHWHGAAIFQSLAATCTWMCFSPCFRSREDVSFPRKQRREVITSSTRLSPRINLNLLIMAFCVQVIHSL